mmetsp:Transcript_10225/g.12772  ORF Transcript_10225/g.12772 Transcript_10225/m.12772 type:complete len:177 (-) Transcript_10225:305-835(-)
MVESELLLCSTGDADIATNRQPAQPISNHETQSVNDCETVFQEKVTAAQYMWETSKKAVPMSINFMLTYSINIVSLYFIGNQNEPDLLAGIGLGFCLINILALGVGIGFVDSSSALISQSYGSGMLKECGVYFMRTKLVVTVFMMFCAILFFNIEPLLVLMGQEPRIAAIATEVCC